MVLGFGVHHSLDQSVNFKQYLPTLIWKYITRLPMKGQFFTTPKQMLTIFNKQLIFLIGRTLSLILTLIPKCPFFPSVHVLNILNNYILHETKICDDHDPSWITTKTKELISQKNKLYFRIKKIIFFSTNGSFIVCNNI